MTAGRPGGGDNLWRDVAATVLTELSNSLRKARDQLDNQRASYDATPDDDSLKTDGVSWRTQNPIRSTSSTTMSDLGRDFKDMVSSGLKVTSESINRYQSERTQRQQRAPIRRARSRAVTRFIGAGFLGLGALGGITSAAYGLTDHQITYEDDGETEVIAEVPASTAITAGVLGLGMGTGAVALTVSGRRYSKRARELEEALEASSLSTARFTGPSPAAAPLPPKDSAAHQPMRQLLGQRQALAELLPEVAEIAPDLQPLAAESEQALYGVAERITLLERARDAGGGAAGDAGISVPLQRLVNQLEDGVAAHQKLVDAAATVLAELSTTHVPGAGEHSDLGEAADRLDALADGLRQVRSDVQVEHPSFLDDDPTTSPGASPGLAVPREPDRGGAKRNRARGDRA